MSSKAHYFALPLATRRMRPRRFSELLDPLLQDVPELAAMTPDFEFALDDLSHQTDAAKRRFLAGGKFR